MIKSYLDSGRVQSDLMVNSQEKMTPELVETVGYGMYKGHRNRKEEIVRVTKTLVITEFGRYDKKTGMNIDITNKSVGGFKLSEESKVIVNQSK